MNGVLSTWKPAFPIWSLSLFLSVFIQSTNLSPWTHGTLQILNTNSYHMLKMQFHSWLTVAWEHPVPKPCSSVPRGYLQLPALLLHRLWVLCDHSVFIVRQENSPTKTKINTRRMHCMQLQRESGWMPQTQGVTWGPACPAARPVQIHTLATVFPGWQSPQVHLKRSPDLSLSSALNTVSTPSMYVYIFKLMILKNAERKGLLTSKISVQKIALN